MLFAKSISPTSLLPALLVVALAGCGQADEKPAAAPPPAVVEPPSQAQQAGQAEAADRADGLDLSDVPVSTVTMGAFPYLSLPDGYRTAEASTFDLDRAPFWVGNEFHWVEGRVHQAAIFADPGKQFAELELQNYVDEMLDRVGAVLLSEADEIPMHLATGAGLDEATRLKYRAGLGHFYSRPVKTYVVRRADGDIWVHFTSHERGASWIIARSAEYDPTIRLLSGVELKRLIDADGRAIIHVNFGSGDAVVHEASMPQLEQVALLLKRNPDLSLSVNGHTDSQGSAERNLVLSRERAQAVTEILRNHGIDGDRLRAEGFGDAEPIADNATAAGRARNRRVELVKR